MCFHHPCPNIFQPLSISFLLLLLLLHLILQSLNTSLVYFSLVLMQSFTSWTSPETRRLFSALIIMFDNRLNCKTAVDMLVQLCLRWLCLQALAGVILFYSPLRSTCLLKFKNSLSQPFPSCNQLDWEFENGDPQSGGDSGTLCTYIWWNINLVETKPNQSSKKKINKIIFISKISRAHLNRHSLNDNLQIYMVTSL